MNTLLIPVDPNLTKPLYLQIVDHITALARNGQLQAGDSLPPSRTLAEQLRVHRSTVVNAYEELKARGVIEARQGSGSFVVDGLRVVMTTPKNVVTTAFAQPENFVSELWRLSRVEGIISLALGLPADELAPLQELDRARQRVLRRDGVKAIAEEDAQGFYPLRRAIAADLARHGIVATADDLIITWGAREGISLVARALAAAGDEVLIESPTFFGTLFNLKHLGMKIHEFTLTAHGPHWESLSAQLEALSARPRFVCVVPDHQNPTGIRWTMPERHQFLQWTAEHDIPVIEDATYIDLSFEGPPHLPLRALDPEVVYVGSFSKTLLPGLRIGYVLASGRLREHLLTLKAVTSGGGEPLGQRTLAEFLSSENYEAHLQRCNGVYRARRDALLQALELYLPADARWTRPTGGFCVWVQLPLAVSVERVFQRALAQGIAIAPAGAFSLDGSAANAFRVIFSRYPADVLIHAVRVLGTIIAAELNHESRTTLQRRTRLEAIP